MQRRSQVRAVYVPPASLEVIRRITRKNALDPRLEPTDRHMQRWAVSLCGGITEPSLAHLKLMPTGLRIPPLSDEAAAATDQVVASSPAHWRVFIKLWYCTNQPTEVIAKQIGVEKTTLFVERRLLLAYLLGSLTHCGVRIASHRFR